MLTLAAWYITILSLLFLVVSVLMMLIILIQRPKGGGLVGAFGGAGAGSSQATFGAKVGDVLTLTTVVLFLLFLFTAMGLTWTINPEHDRLQQRQSQLLPPENGDEAGGTGDSDLDSDLNPDADEQSNAQPDAQFDAFDASMTTGTGLTQQQSQSEQVTPERVGGEPVGEPIGPAQPEVTDEELVDQGLVPAQPAGGGAPVDQREAQ